MATSQGHRCRLIGKPGGSLFLHPPISQAALHFWTHTYVLHIYTAARHTHATHESIHPEQNDKTKLDTKELRETIQMQCSTAPKLYTFHTKVEDRTHTNTNTLPTEPTNK